ncbi:MAG TPA: aldo/keto reductase, partial [Acidimicrobiales bacterium]|nr:aldo/keto reductase [Acidimicrobiales bacterium]
MDIDMPIRQIGALDVSVVGLGCNNFGGRTDEAQSALVIEAALDAGINFFDTADIYGGTRSEEIIGRAIGKARHDVVLATKFGMQVDSERKGAAPAYVKRALEDSLRRLRTDYVDLYQLHRPDPETPIADTLGALADAVAEGKVREIGCSNFSVAQLEQAEAAVAAGAPRFVSVQNEFSLLQREPELGVLEACHRLGTAFIPYFPLKSGLLSGKYHRGEAPPPGTRLASVPGDRQPEFFNDRTMAAVEALTEFAVEHGHTLLELAIAWLAAKPTVASVICGATQPDQVHANVRAAEWVLSDKEVAEVDAIAPVP